MRVVVSGGGTGGHIYPALALIREIKKRNPEAKFLYIGTEQGLESEIVRREGFPFKTIEISGFKRQLTFANIKTIGRFFSSVKESRRILKEFAPHIVIGTGGYVCGPVVYAATRLKIPTIIHEQNSVPGLTNKFLSKFVTKVAISFTDAAEYFPKNKVVLTGNPRASEVRHFKCDYKKFNLDEHLPVVLIFGGSRGAEPINNAVIDSLLHFKNKQYQIVYATGEIHYEAVKKEIEKIGGLDNVIVKPFIHQMPQLLACVDLVVCRAGATTLAELTSLGLASVLIPSPYVTNNHQVKNATALSEQGAAHLLLQADLNATSLIKLVDKVLDKDQLTVMANKSKELGIPDAAERFYDLVVSLTKNNST